VDRPFLEVQSPYPDLELLSYQAFHCEHCGLIYMSPDPPEADLERIYSGEDYLDSLLDNPKWRQWVIPNHWLKVLKVIEENAPGQRLLDIGCSDGLFMDFASESGWEVFGVDINREKLRCAQQQHRDRAKFGSIYNLDWPDAYFDIIRVCHVLEHLVKPRDALVQLHRVLRPRGLLNVGVPILDDAIFRMLKLVPLSPLRMKVTKIVGWIAPPHHITTWSTRSLQSILEACGFEIIWKAYRSDVFPWIRGYRRFYVLYRAVGIPMKILGTGATIEVIARKTS
jgi:2-polyprenyl-3-methyl-5-hydroxy-6-metoxy-1,4-benzoquinol methylase